MKILYILLMLTSFSMFSQSPKINNHLYDGNEKVKNEDFLGAEVNYRLALSKQPETPKALPVDANNMAYLETSNRLNPKSEVTSATTALWPTTSLCNITPLAVSFVTTHNTSSSTFDSACLSQDFDEKSIYLPDPWSKNKDPLNP